MARLPPRGEGPDEESPGFRGLPYLLKASRAWSRVRADAAISRFPQYALELGLRCAATGTDEGRVFLTFERAGSDAERIEVLRYRFAEPERFGRLGEHRARQLRTAITTGTSLGLPACPAWMFDGCPYRAECGCRSPDGRSQR